MKKLSVWMLLFVFVLTAGLGGCSPAAAPTPTQGPASLKITVLPILDALPMYVAQDQGLFAKNNLQVEFIPAGSAPERDQLIAAGQADGMINEVVSVLFFNKESVRVQIVRYARSATSDSPLFSILASQTSQITSVAGLKGAPIGISDGTVIAYLTDRLLAAEGFQRSDIQTVSVPKIDARLALLKSGELKAAVLPEPATSAALQQGAKVILDDTRHPEYSFSTISFRKETLEKNPQAVKSFLIAVEQATDLINQDPSKWAQLLVTQKVLPQPLAAAFKVPAFVKAGVPTEQQYMDAMAWAKEKGYLEKDIPYQDCVNGEFLPK